jgi:hypothetical protein
MDGLVFGEQVTCKNVSKVANPQNAMNITIRGALLDPNNAETDSFTQPSHQQLNSLASCARL